MKLNNVDRSRLGRAVAKVMFEDESLALDKEAALMKIQKKVLPERKWQESYAEELKSRRSKMNYYINKHLNRYAKQNKIEVPTEPPFGPLEEGGYYVRRDGKTAGPAVLTDRKSRPWRVFPGYYNANGRINKDHKLHQLDLVAIGKEEDVIKRRGGLPAWILKALGK